MAQSHIEELLTDIFPRKITLSDPEVVDDALPKIIAFWNYLKRNSTEKRRRDIELPPFAETGGFQRVDERLHSIRDSKILFYDGQIRRVRYDEPGRTQQVYDRLQPQPCSFPQPRCSDALGA